MVNQGLAARVVALLLFLYQPALSGAFHYSSAGKVTASTLTNIPSNSDKAMICNTCTKLSMGLYEEDNDIDWDSDLFGQIGNKSNDENPPSQDSQKSSNELNAWDDDSQWDMGQPKRSNNSNSVKSMREQMKQSWGEGETNKKKGKEEGKPTADWMPGFGNVPEEDEPWYTG